MYASRTQKMERCDALKPFTYYQLRYILSVCLIHSHERTHIVSQIVSMACCLQCNHMEIVIISNHLSRNQFHTITRLPSDKAIAAKIQTQYKYRQHPNEQQQLLRLTREFKKKPEQIFRILNERKRMLQCVIAFICTTWHRFCIRWKWTRDFEIAIAIATVKINLQHTQTNTH